MIIFLSSLRENRKKCHLWQYLRAICPPPSTQYYGDQNISFSLYHDFQWNWIISIIGKIMDSGVFFCLDLNVNYESMGYASKYWLPVLLSRNQFLGIILKIFVNNMCAKSIRLLLKCHFNAPCVFLSFSLCMFVYNFESMLTHDY